MCWQFPRDQTTERMLRVGLCLIQTSVAETGLVTEVYCMKQTLNKWTSNRRFPTGTRCPNNLHWLWILSVSRALKADQQINNINNINNIHISEFRIQRILILANLNMWNVLLVCLDFSMCETTHSEISVLYCAILVTQTSISQPCRGISCTQLS